MSSSELFAGGKEGDGNFEWKTLLSLYSYSCHVLGCVVLLEFLLKLDLKL